MYFSVYKTLFDQKIQFKIIIFLHLHEILQMTSNNTSQVDIDLIGIKNYWIIININLQNSLCSFIPALNDSILL